MRVSFCVCRCVNLHIEIDGSRLLYEPFIIRPTIPRPPHLSRFIAMLKECLYGPLVSTFRFMLETRVSSAMDAITGRGYLRAHPAPPVVNTTAYCADAKRSCR